VPNIFAVADFPLLQHSSTPSLQDSITVGVASLNYCH
jgi:hypothetical protein